MNDMLAVFRRESMLLVRDPLSAVFAILQPVVFLALFGPLLGSTLAAGMFEGESTWQWFVPGILVMLLVFGTAGTGYTLQTELTTGSFDRLLVAPLSRSAIFIGRSLRELAPLLIQATLIILVMIPFGFELHPLPALLGLLLLGLFGIGMGGLSNALAIATRKSEWVFWSVQTTLQFPLVILSGMLLPMEVAPGWLQTVAAFNPLKYIVDAERMLFAGNMIDPAVLYGVIAALLTCAIGLYAGVIAIRNATR